jgi:hypothetical protein
MSWCPLKIPTRFEFLTPITRDGHQLSHLFGLPSVDHILRVHVFSFQCTLCECLEYAYVPPVPSDVCLHDDDTFQCLEGVCKCDGYLNSLRCKVCDKPGTIHLSVFSTEAQRQAQGRNTGFDFFPPGSNPLDYVSRRPEFPPLQSPPPQRVPSRHVWGRTPTPVIPPVRGLPKHMVSPKPKGVVTHSPERGSPDAPMDQDDLGPSKVHEPDDPVIPPKALFEFH